MHLPPLLSPHCPPRPARGFTLVELLVVMSIIAILAAIALPAYQDSVRKSNRRAAQAEMMEIANRQGLHFFPNKSYADKTAIEKVYALNDKVSQFYDYEINVADTPMPSYLITFKAKGSQLKDGDLTLNDQGVKTPAGKW